MMSSDEVGAAEASTLLQLLSSLVSVRIEDKIAECHRRADGQSCMVFCWLAFPDIPVAHLGSVNSVM